MDILIVVAFAVFLGLIGGAIAYKKNRNIYLWFALSAVFVAIPALVLMFLPALTEDGSAKKEEAQGKTSFPTGKVVTIFVIVGGAYAYISMLENEKKEIATATKSSLINNCNADKTCIQKVESNFDKCIEANLTIERKGKKSREVALNDEGLQSCIGI